MKIELQSENHMTLPVTFSNLRELLGALYYRRDDRF